MLWARYSESAQIDNISRSQGYNVCSALEANVSYGLSG